jgi:hypothetical protein
MANICWSASRPALVQRAAIVLREKNVDFEFRHIGPTTDPIGSSPYRRTRRCRCCASTIASLFDRMPSPSI